MNPCQLKFGVLMDSLGNRLREERERLGLSQEAFGEIGGVKKLAQRNYEKGNRQPDASYLTAVAAIGVDVMYVLTGQRVAPVQPALSRREAALVDNYRHCAQEDQQAIDRVALNAAKTQPDLLNTDKAVKTAS